MEKREQYGPAGPGPVEGDEGFGGSDKMQRLYTEADAVKMLNLRQILRARAGSGPEGSAEAMKSSQLALKAIMLQLKILSEEFRQEGQRVVPEKIELIWEAMSRVPSLRGLVSRGAIREQVMENLREMFEGEEGVGS